MSIARVLARTGAQKPASEEASSQIADAPTRTRRLRSEVSSRFALVGVWILMSVAFAALKPSEFLSIASFTTIFGSQSALVILTLSLLITLMIGEFDLSAAAVLGLSATLIATLNVNYKVQIGWCILAALASGAAVGAVNGLLVVRFRVNVLVVTLGMGTFLVGIAMWFSGNVTIADVSPGLVAATNNSLLSLPYSFYYAMAASILVWYVFEHTPLGRYLLFVGSGREVARLAGVRVEAIRLGGFIAGGVMSAFAGVVIVGTLGAFQASQSPAYLLPAFAAAFLGTAAVKPGRFNAWGSVIAIYFLVTGITGLVLLGLSGWIDNVFYGGALVVAVTVSTVARGRFASGQRSSARKSRQLAHPGSLET